VIEDRYDDSNFRDLIVSIGAASFVVGAYLALDTRHAINPDNTLDLIRDDYAFPPFAKGGQGGFECCGDSKIPLCPSQALPLLKRGRLVKFPNGLSGINTLNLLCDLMTSVQLLTAFNAMKTRHKWRLFRAGRFDQCANIGWRSCHLIRN